MGEHIEYTAELIPRILRDIDDGIIALDERGRIIYMNPQCRDLLGLDGDATGRTYAEVFFAEGHGNENDSFHQLVIDAVYAKEQTHYGSVVFYNKNNEKRYLRITSSFLNNDDENESGGIVMVISDVTEAETLRRKKLEAVVVFSCTTSSVCVYLVLLSALDFVNISLSTKILTQVINAIVFAFCTFTYKKLNYSLDDLGLKIKDYKKTFIPAIAISLVVLALLMAVKLLMLKTTPGFFAEGTPFWNWNIGIYAWVSYVFTCIIQELLARSMVYGSLRKIFDGKKGFCVATAISVLLFGAVHIAHGFANMLGAMILLGSLCGLYDKQRNIWGVALIHYVLGQAVFCLGFL